MKATNICLVDDEVEITELYAGYLKDFYDVRTFTSAEQALDAFDQEYRPGVIVTDIKMPRITGLEFIDETRKKGLETPVVVITGYADKDCAVRSIEKNVHGFLEKPFDLKHLKALIDRVARGELYDQFKESFFKKNLELSLLNAELLTFYRERYQIAENALFEANVPVRQPQPAVKHFLEKMHNETELERQIESLSQEIQDLSRSYVALFGKDVS